MMMELLHYYKHWNLTKRNYIICKYWSLLIEAHVTLLASVLKACTKLTGAVLCFKNIDSDSMNCLADGLSSLFHLKHLAILCEGSTPGAITVLLHRLQHLTNVDIQLRLTHLSISNVVG